MLTLALKLFLTWAKNLKCNLVLTTELKTEIEHRKEFKDFEAFKLFTVINLRFQLSC